MKYAALPVPLAIDCEMLSIETIYVSSPSRMSSSIMIIFTHCSSPSLLSGVNVTDASLGGMKSSVFRESFYFTAKRHTNKYKIIVILLT